MLVQSGTARNAMEILIGDREWCDYTIEADLRNVGGRWAFPFLVNVFIYGLIYLEIAPARAWGHPGVIFHAQDVNNYEVIYFRPHSFHSGTTFLCYADIRAPAHSCKSQASSTDLRQTKL